VELPRTLVGNRISYVLREKKNDQGVTTKIGLRSNPPVTIGQVAQHFGGGGHAQAAGATVPKPIAEILPELLPLLRAALA